MKIKHLTLAMAAAAALALAAALPAAMVSHQPVVASTLGVPVAISAEALGVKGAALARLYWRARGKELWKSAMMSLEGTTLQGEIPAADFGAAGVEYYIELKDAVGTSTAPATNPRQAPYFVAMRRDAGGPGISVLSPLEGEAITSARPVITAAFGETDSGVDVGSVKVLVDGKAVEGVQAFPTLASWVCDRDLAPGAHTVVVKVRDRSGNAGSREWSFTVAPSVVSGKAGAEAPAARLWSVEGSASAETEYNPVLRQPRDDRARVAMPYHMYGANRARLNATARGPNQEYSLEVYKTDEERDDQQPTDWYKAQFSSDEAVITLGDQSPAFSTLSLYNPARLRGASLDLRSGALYESHSRLVAVGGQTLRAVGAGGGDLGVSATPTYAQYLYGVRYELGITRFFTWGLNNVTINDDAENIKQKQGASPASNTLATTDMKISIPQIGLGLDGEAGGDLYARDEGILSTSVGTAYKAGAHLNLQRWTGTKADFEWRDLGGGTSWLPGGYTTMANPGLQADYRGFESELFQGLLDNQISIDLSWNRWRDNLQGLKYTTQTQYLYGSLAVAPQDWPSVTLGYGRQTQVNDADDASTTTSAKVDMVYDNMNASLGYSRVLGNGLALSGSLNYLLNRSADQAPVRTNFDQMSQTYVATLFASLRDTSVNLNASFGGMEYVGAGTAPGYYQASQSLGGRVTRSWVPGAFSSYAGYDFSRTSSNTLASWWNQRHTVSTGATYYPFKNHTLTLALAWASVSLSGKDAVLADQDNAYDQMYANLKYSLKF